MTRETQRALGGVELPKLKLAGDAQEGVLLGEEESELAFFAGQVGGVGIFDDGGQRRIGHGETARTPAVEAVGESAQGVGVALEVGEVGPLALGETVAQVSAFAFGEERGDRLLAAVTEGGIAQIVGQAGGRDDVSEVVELVDPVASGIARGAQFGGDGVGHRLAHRADLERVGQAVVDEDGAREREHLRLVLKAAEGRREHQSVVVAAEVGALAALAVAVDVLQP